MPRKGWHCGYHIPRDRKREWSYIKHRKQPSGVMGRPRSPVPLPVRRKLARQTYRAKLTTRGLVSVRLLLPAEAAAQLRTLAQARRLTPGELVASLLQTEHGS